MNLIDTIGTKAGKKVFLQLFLKFQTLDVVSKNCEYRVKLIQEKLQMKKNVNRNTKDRLILSKKYPYSASRVKIYVNLWKDHYLNKISGKRYRTTINPFFDYLETKKCKLNNKEMKLLELFSEHECIRRLVIKNSDPEFIDGCKWVMNNIFVKNWMNTDSLFYSSTLSNENLFKNLLLPTVSSGGEKIKYHIEKYPNKDFKNKNDEIKFRKKIVKELHDSWEVSKFYFNNFNQLLAFYFWKVLNQRELLCKLSSVLIDPANKEIHLSKFDEAANLIKDNINEFGIRRKKGLLKALKKVLIYRELFLNGEISKSKNSEIEKLIRNLA